MALRIGLDLDGVCVGFEQGWVAAYETAYAVKIDRKKLGSWQSWKDVTQFESEAEFWVWTDSVPGFWENLPPVPGMQGALHTWQARYGHTVEIVTSRHEKTRAATLEWVRRNLPTATSLPRIHHVAKTQKGLVDCQVYVDDNPAVIESLAEKPCVIVFDQPWNREVPSAHNVHRVRGWSELSRFLHLIEHPEDTESTDTPPAAA